MTPIQRRYAESMVTLACLFWVTSGAFILRWSVEFPNCITAYRGSRQFAIGLLSHNGVSSVFITRHVSLPPAVWWTERSDGHFCDFRVPTAPPGDYGPDGFSLLIGVNSIAWDLPYWLIAVVWIAILLSRDPATKYRVRDLLIQTAVVAITCALIHHRSVLPLVLLVNLSTVGVVFAFVVRLIGRQLRPSAAKLAE